MVTDHKTQLENVSLELSKKKAELEALDAVLKEKQVSIDQKIVVVTQRESKCDEKEAFLSNKEKQLIGYKGELYVLEGKIKKLALDNGKTYKEIVL